MGTDVKTYSSRSNCVAGATALGEGSQQGRDFAVAVDEKTKRWSWKPLETSCRPRGQPEDDAPIPKFLDRTIGKTKAQIAAEREKNKHTKIVSPSFASSKAAPKKAAPAKAAGLGDLKAGSKMALMVTMALSHGGATEEEMCKALGWKKCLVTLRRACARAGFDLKGVPDKDGGPTAWVASGRKAKAA